MANPLQYASPFGTNSPNDLAAILDALQSAVNAQPTETPFDVQARKLSGAVHLAPRGPEYTEGMQNIAEMAAGASPVGAGASLIHALLPLIGGLLAPDSAEAAGPRLTRDQQRQMEMQRQQAQIDADAAAAKAKSQGEASAASAGAIAKAQADADAQRRRDELEAERTRRQDTADFEAKSRDQAKADAAAAEHEWANKPFNQRYPHLAESLPAIGTALALAIPYAKSVSGVAARTAAARPFFSGVEHGEQALASGAPMERTAALGELKALKKTPVPEAQGVGPWTMAGAAALPAEGALMPAEFNAMALPSDNPEQQKAFNMLTSPSELMQRLYPALLAGGLGASIGAKLPVKAGEAVPSARIQGLIDALTPPKAPRKAPRKAPAAAD